MTKSYLNNIIENIKKDNEIKNKKILLQLPEGLWTYVKEIISILEDKGNKVFWYKSKSYGACDLPLEESKRLNVNMVLHIGHKPFIELYEWKGIKIKYLEIYIDYDIDYVVRELEKYNVNDGVLVGHLPYTHLFEKIMKKAEEKNIELELNNKHNLLNPGQILGCNVVNAISDKPLIIYVGDGVFHLKGLYTLNKPIIAINPLSKGVTKIKSIEIKEYQKRKYVAYGLLKSSHKIGVLMSSKIGQYTVFTKPIIDLIEKEFKDKEIIWIMENDIKKEELKFIDVDIFLNLACPRLEDDIFSKPIISWQTYIRIKNEMK